MFLKKTGLELIDLDVIELKDINHNILVMGG